MVDVGLMPDGDQEVVLVEQGAFAWAQRVEKGV